MPDINRARLPDLAQARSELRALAQLFEAALLVQDDLCRRAKQEHTHGLLRQRQQFGRLADRIGDAYVAALAQYRLALFQSAITAEYRNPSKVSVAN